MVAYREAIELASDLMVRCAAMKAEESIRRIS
jgi:hypothetical protein